ncbi:MAG TPA: hypothetical protein VJ723_02830 [Candidatus Angelobacter sp.]|nr:hypothetical protein [Candidatus Angelobacter sp.]
MFARILEFGVKIEKRAEFIKVLKNEVVPILKKQVGFREILPFFPDKVGDNVALNITLWTTKTDAERFQNETYPRVYEIVKPFLTTPVTMRLVTLETTLSEHLVETFAA